MKQVFIGSSIQSIEYAKIIHFILKKLGTEPMLWEDIFPTSQITIDSLLNAAHNFDNAVFIFNKDDQIISPNGKKQFITRDNVIFESGLFMGALNRPSVALCVHPETKKSPTWMA